MWRGNTTDNHDIHFLYPSGFPRKSMEKVDLSGNVGFSTTILDMPCFLYIYSALKPLFKKKLLTNANWFPGMLCFVSWHALIPRTGCLDNYSDSFPALCSEYKSVMLNLQLSNPGFSIYTIISSTLFPSSSQIKFHMVIYPQIVPWISKSILS